MPTFAEPALPWRVDLEDRATKSEPFRRVMQRGKVVVQAVEAASADTR